MRTSWASALLGAVVITLAGGGLGLAFNAVRTGGLPAAPADPAAGTAACSAGGSTTQVPEVLLAEAQALYGQPKVTFVDARSSSDYRGGHVRGALNLPYEVAAQAAGKSSLPVPRDHRLIVYCDVDCQLSSELAQLLSNSGCERVRVLKGGFPGWREAGQPIALGAEP